MGAVFYAVCLIDCSTESQSQSPVDEIFVTIVCIKRMITVQEEVMLPLLDLE
jgi:hypothetical protein